MSRFSVRYGIDRCPATKNYSYETHCRHCDFRGSEKKDCCECVYSLFKHRGSGKSR